MVPGAVSSGGAAPQRRQHPSTSSKPEEARFFPAAPPSLFLSDQEKILVPVQRGSCRGARRGHWSFDSPGQSLQSHFSPSDL